MTFRTRVGVALTAAAFLPLLLLVLGVRREMTGRLERQAERRVMALVDVLHAVVAAEAGRARTQVADLASELADDNRFRLAVLRGGAERRWLIDWAGDATRRSGLAVLRLQDSAGRVLSSGHFRNEYDQLEPGLPEALRSTGEHPTLIRLATPDGEVLALAALDSFRVAGRLFLLTGGVAFDSVRAAALVPSDEITVALVPGATGDVPLRYHDAVSGGSTGSAGLVVTRDPEALVALRQSVDRWFAAAVALTVLLGALLSAWLSARVSRPLAELAEKTARLDLNRLDQDFATERDDEIGVLGNLLDAMTRRLRAGTVRLRDAERRAATGDVARQVTHDIKNGLAPIRHVLRHFGEAARREPERMAELYLDRQETLEASVSYLEQLARNYARLAPAAARGPSDLAGLLRDVGGAATVEGVNVEVQVADDLPGLRADAVSLRRIVENLVTNAVEALEGAPGRVTLSAAPIRNGDARLVRLAVSDSGRGMSQDELDRAFDDFYTTRTGGTGLGLSVVRRIVADHGGTLRVETAPGQGSTFIVEMPAA